MIFFSFTLCFYFMSMYQEKFLDLEYLHISMRLKGVLWFENEYAKMTFTLLVWLIGLVVFDTPKIKFTKLWIIVSRFLFVSLQKATKNVISIHHKIISHVFNKG